MRVLLIDDEEELVTTLVERLVLRQIEAEWAGQGREALERMQQQIFDAVIVDLGLPGMSGTEVIRRIAVDYPAVKILLITGRGASSHELLEPAARGPNPEYEMLLKPVNIDVLVEALHRAVGRPTP